MPRTRMDWSSCVWQWTSRYDFVPTPPSYCLVFFSAVLCYTCDFYSTFLIANCVINHYFRFVASTLSAALSDIK